MDKINTKIFLKVAEAGSFRKAADELNYTQAGISYAINAMEEELGLRLFTREYGGVRLTPDGTELLPVMKELNRNENRLREKAREIADLQAGTVRVVACNSVAVNWMPDLIAGFRKDYPAITVELTVDDDLDTSCKMISDMDADVGFFQKKPSGQVTAVPIMEEPVVAAVNSEHPLCETGVFPVKELGRYPYIKMPADENLGADELFRKAGQKPDVIFETDSDYIALAMINKGIGFGIFPELMLKNSPFGISILEFDKPLQRTIWMGHGDEETMGIAAREFFGFARDSLVKADKQSFNLQQKSPVSVFTRQVLYFFLLTDKWQNTRRI